MPRGKPGKFGFAAAQELRPTKKLRKYYKRTAKRQAAQMFRPERRALRKQIKRSRRAMNKDIASVDAAASLFSDVVANAQKGLKNSGLKGRYMKEAAREFSDRQLDVAQSVPYLKSQVRQEHLPGIQDQRNQLLSSRMEQMRSAQETYQSLVAGGMEEAQQALAERQEQRRKGNPALQTGLLLTQQAHERYQKLLSARPKDLSEEDRALRKSIEELWANDPDYYWSLVSGEVAGGEGVNPIQAERSVRMFRQAVERAQQADSVTNTVGAFAPALNPILGLAGGVAKAAMGVPQQPDAGELYRLWLRSRRGRR